MAKDKEPDLAEVAKGKHRERVVAAAVAERDRAEKEDRWRQVAHVCDAHDGLLCCDCGRALVSDSGTERIMVCPKLHGVRPAELRADDAPVECGQQGI